MLDRTPAIRRAVSPGVLSPPARALPHHSEALSARAAFQLHGHEIERLRRSLPEETRYLFTPEWQGARPLPRGWRQRVLLLRESGVLQAAFFYRERTFLGLRTGFCRGGNALGEPLLLCAAERHAEMSAKATTELLSARRNFLLLLDTPAGEDLSFLAVPGNGLETHSVQTTIWWRHTLQPTFDTSIATFGHRTRRNLRHALRHVQRAGWEFLPELTEAEMQAAMKSLAARATHPVPDGALQARMDLTQALPAFSMGLRDRHGVWLSVLTGRRTPDGITEIFWQSNARVPSESVCLTLRALLVAEEVRRGTRQLRYLGGTNPLLEHCCEEETSTQTSVARTGLRLRVLRWLMRTRLPSLAHPLRQHLSQTVDQRS